MTHQCNESKEIVNFKKANISFADFGDDILKYIFSYINPSKLFSISVTSHNMYNATKCMIEKEYIYMQRIITYNILCRKCDEICNIYKAKAIDKIPKWACYHNKNTLSIWKCNECDPPNDDYY